MPRSPQMCRCRSRGLVAAKGRNARPTSRRPRTTAGAPPTPACRTSGQPRGTKSPHSRNCGGTRAGRNCTAWNSGGRTPRETGPVRAEQASDDRDQNEHPRRSGNIQPEQPHATADAPPPAPRPGPNATAYPTTRSGLPVGTASSRSRVPTAAPAASPCGHQEHHEEREQPQQRPDRASNRPAVSEKIHPSNAMNTHGITSEQRKGAVVVPYLREHPGGGGHGQPGAHDGPPASRPGASCGPGEIYRCLCCRCR